MNSSQISPDDKRGLIWFLVITFGFTYSVLFALWLRDVSLVEKHPLYAHFTLAFAIFAPGVVAYVVREKFCGGVNLDKDLAVGDYRNYIKVYFGVPLVFAVVYGLTALFVADPDATTIVSKEWDEKTRAAGPLWKYANTAILVSLTTGPIISGLHAVGQEYGWRGYLLETLLPLGKRKAVIISSAIWGLWYGPFVLLGLHYQEGSLLLGTLFFALLIMLLGICLGYLKIVSGSIILTSFAHGAFNAQLYGGWTIYFPNLDPIAGGITGLPGLLVFLILALFLLSRKSMGENSENKQ